MGANKDTPRAPRGSRTQGCKVHNTLSLKIEYIKGMWKKQKVLQIYLLLCSCGLMGCALPKL